MAHGAERAIDDIIEHTYQISVCKIHVIFSIFFIWHHQCIELFPSFTKQIWSFTFSLYILHICGFKFFLKSLTTFEYVEPNGKDMGINVRKKAENVVALLNNKEKIQEVRSKAAANREK